MPKKRKVVKKVSKGTAAQKRARTILSKQEKIKLQVLELLTTVPIVKAVVAKAGISTSTFYRYVDEDRAFAEAVEKAKLLGVQEVNDIAESKVISGIHKNDKTYVIFWLKNRHKEFGDKLRHDHRHKFEPTITPERQQQIAHALKLWNKGMAEGFKDDDEQLPDED